MGAACRSVETQVSYGAVFSPPSYAHIADEPRLLFDL